MNTTGLIVQNLAKKVGARTILNNVSLQVNKAEVVALLGPNGAGKTSCFQAIIGLNDISSGTITLGGQNVSALPMYRRARLGLGYLPQESSIFRGLTVAQNLRAVLEMVCKTHAEQETRLAELLTEFGLEKVKDSPATALSGGERRRVEIARALATNPSFMMLDEPFAGVDPLAIRDVKNLVTHLKQRGMGVLITDHNVRDTLALVDRAYIISEGKIIASGTPKEITQNPDVKRVYLGEDFQLA
ncbi:MAG: LPS export ABC transporter ATP-binding protein [Proteobacteria bacterium]|nr:LPS export ABC transporter ATP-binding protein [Pseudomonadota bacterium]NBX85791.1 LPS export ABC transporter ATP-binding protein [Pseudomonadota bacterium]